MNSVRICAHTIETVSELPSTAITGKYAMNILLSAYACEPHRGSEPGVGWNWAVQLVRRGHTVHVITRANNRNVIEAELTRQPMAGLSFSYFDLPRWSRIWKRGGRGVHAYYLLWQAGAAMVARRLARSESFDLVHHVTFVSVRQPSFMGLLGIPFLFGPVAGGESTPYALRRGLSVNGRIQERLRDAANLLPKLDPLMRLTFGTARWIVVTSEETRKLVPSRFHWKTSLGMAIGANPAGHVLPREPRRAGGIQMVYAGRLVQLKGIHLALAALQQVLLTDPMATLVIIGDGPDREWLERLAESLGVCGAVQWVPWLSQAELANRMSQADVFLFPSLHDSGGLVVLEAMQQGTPVVCLRLGGPGQLVDETCGYAVEVDGRSEADVIGDLAFQIMGLMDSTRWASASNGARNRASTREWSGTVKNVYEAIELVLNDLKR